MKATKTFSLNKDVLAEVKRTKGLSSESERVNSLLKFCTRPGETRCATQGGWKFFFE